MYYRNAKDRLEIIWTDADWAYLRAVCSSAMFLDGKWGTNVKHFSGRDSNSDSLKKKKCDLSNKGV
jgi:hypothetical protein